MTNPPVTEEAVERTTHPINEVETVAQAVFDEMKAMAQEHPGAVEPPPSLDNLNSDEREFIDRIAKAARTAMNLDAMREALDSALDFVVDVMNEAAPGSIYHTNAVECHRKGVAALKEQPHG